VDVARGADLPGAGKGGPEERWTTELAGAAVRVAGAELAAGGHRGTIGIIVAPSLLPPVAAGLDAAGIPFGRVGDGALDSDLTLLSMDDAKGLEFDSVVVVEPARLVAESPRGDRAVYVALTRATRRLTIVHADRLPPALAGPLAVTSEVG
jgi:UvrD-like helicase C-terminal domain